METDIRSISKEVKSYFFQITKADNDNSLTTIQKEKYRDFIRKSIEAKGAKYSLETHYDAPRRINFNFQDLYVNEIGIINDVRPKGAFPFSISMEDNISILYDPRNVEKLDLSEKSELNNNDFLNFQKGIEYQFKGKILGCSYYYNEPGSFHFSIMGSASLSKDGHCFIATACYENYDAPEVLVLRQFRDDRLLKSFLGKLFVKFYYLASPFFVLIISKSPFLKKIIRQYFLEPIVTKLQQ